MSGSDSARLLRGVALFAAMPDKELQVIARATREVQHAAGKEVAHEGSKEAAPGFHLILDGTATVILPNGRVVRQLSAGDYFGEISLIDGGPRSATVRADTPLRTLSIASWEFKPLLDEHPAIARYMLVEICRKLRAAEAAQTV